jgi:hypothetical protein
VTADRDGTVRPDPFGGAPGVEPFVWTNDEGPQQPVAYELEPVDDRPPSRPATPAFAGLEAVTPSAPEPAAPRPSAAPAPDRRHERWGGLPVALVITLVVSGPILLIELNWRGSGVTGQPHYLWAAAFGAVALSFAAGGFVIGRRAESYNTAFAQAVTLTLLSCGLLALAAVIRALIVGGSFPRASTYLWFVIEIGVLAWCACGGALLGRWFSLRSTVG